MDKATLANLVTGVDLLLVYDLLRSLLLFSVLIYLLLNISITGVMFNPLVIDGANGGHPGRSDI